MEKLLPSTPPEAHGFRKLEGAVNDAAWWARVVQARTERDDLRPQRVWTLHKGDHAAAIEPEGGARHRRGDRAYRGRAVAQDAAVPLPPAGGTGRRDCGHAD